jgi:uncharacterized protein YbaR (Trm112 family)
MPADSNSSDFLSAFSTLRKQLACPVCYGELRIDAIRLVCVQCGRMYPVVDGIPVMVPESSGQ